MTIQNLLTLAIEAIFCGFTLLMTIDFIYQCTDGFWLPTMPKFEPKTLDELPLDGIYNFGLALKLADLE